MGKYLPYSGNHSIQEAVVIIRLQRMVDEQELEHARNVVRTSLREAFPHLRALHELHAVNVNHAQEGAAPEKLEESPRLGGFEFIKMKSNAQPSHVLNFLNDTLSISFLDYKDWEITLKDSLEYIGTVLPAIALAKNPVTAFGLKYVDRFTFDGHLEESHAGLLLKPKNEFIAEHCFNSGPLWHCNSGWFEENRNEYRILNQLNVRSMVVDQALTVFIDHNAVCQLRVPRQSTESLFQSSSDTEAGGIKQVLERMHERNKSILSAILLPEILKSIGLDT